MIEAAPAPLPADLRGLLDEFDAIERDSEAIVDPLDDDQFNWSPRRGAWSIAQCVAHLNAMNAIYFDAVARAVDEARRAGLARRDAIRSTWAGRRFIASLEPPPRLKLRAPRRSAPPAARRYKAEVWPEFVRFHAHLRGELGAMANVDLNRAAFPNPFLGPLVRVRAGTGLRIIAAHERRHVWQASRVLESEGFPR
jgi:hypothetical protein